MAPSSLGPPLGPTMSVRLLALSLTVLLPILAGCLEEPLSETATSDPVPANPKSELLSLLESLPAVEKYDRAKGVAWWENFVTTYDYRLWGTPKNLAAAQYLRSELAASGYQAEILSYRTTVAGTAAPGDFLLVRGLKQGTESPDHRLVLVAHYDTVPMTAQGAYDDGSGVAIQMEICKLLAKVPTNKTIECVFFDGEERGLVASAAYTADYARGGKDWIWDQAFGYDMTGLNWPGYSTWKLYAMIGTDTKDLGEYTPGHQEFLNVTVYSFLGERLGVKPEGVEVLPKHDRNSDEQNFKRIGVPVVRFAGGRRPGEYPMYHQPLDTVPYVYSFACGMCTDLNRGKELFQKGFEMVVLVSYYTILAYDQYDPKGLPF